jgi:hypothetical protein
MSFPPGTEIFQFPGFASPHYGFMWRYPKGVGCPIRTSTDQRLLAAPRGFSQRATSFIASWCQGIHRMPFSRSRSQHIFRRVIHHAQKPSSAVVDHKAVTDRKGVPAHRRSLLLSTQQSSSERCPARWRPPNEGQHIRSDMRAGTPRDAPEPDSP